jgi:hypothetical protein
LKQVCVRANGAQLHAPVTAQRILDGTQDGIDGGPFLAHAKSLLPQGRNQDAFLEAFCGHCFKCSDPGE